jgi:glyoxylase-like metal-dependent hydrolase (beta-lactamase superfamily II)
MNAGRREDLAMTAEPPPPQLAELPNGGWDSRLRMFRAGDEVDTFALVTRRYVVMIDTMSTPELAAGIVAALAGDLRRRQLLVVNTHADYDHCWGNAIFAAPGGAHPAPIIGHALARQRLLGRLARQKLRARQRQEARFASVVLVPPSITFTSALRIDGGDLALELLHTPGHTADHVAVWVPELRLVLAGDTAELPWPKVGSAATLPRLRRSLARLRRLDPLRVLPCHGGTTTPALLARNLAYFDNLAAQAQAALAAHALPSEWDTRDDLPALIGVPLAAAARQAGVDHATLPDLYRQFHLTNTRATVRRLNAASGPAAR